MRLRATRRGVALAALGLLAAVLGLLHGSGDLTRIGTLTLLVPVAGWAWARWTDPTRGRASLDLVRRVLPNPLATGQDADVVVTIRSLAGERSRLAGLRLSEQASAELSHGRPLRARVRRDSAHVDIRYAIAAGRRGRWTLGPMLAHHADPFGTVRGQAPLGGTSEVAVWPATVDLELPPGVLVSEPERVALGARSPSTDDAALRDYREGDDLRRVHWASTARRGTILVRSDERAGMRPATVLLDLPGRSPDVTEWTVSAATSIGLALIGAGHPVRLLGARRPPLPGVEEDLDVRSRHIQPGASTQARIELLDHAIDLTPAQQPEEREHDLLTAIHVLVASGSSEELVFAVLGPQSGTSRVALARLAERGNAWALVVPPDRGQVAASEVASTTQSLRKSGWRAIPVEPGEELADSWQRLLGGPA